MYRVTTTDHNNSLFAADTFATREAAAVAANPFAEGDAVEGGDLGTEDQDTGWVSDINGDQVTVNWDSECVTTQHFSALRAA